MKEVSVECDLRYLFGPVRDQGARPTCLAFAASDAHAALRENWTPLSCEYVFYHAQRRSGRPMTVGATLPKVLETLRHEGQPEEKGWPYLSQTPVELEQWRPPQDVGRLFRRAGEIRGNVVDEVVSELNNGRPVLVLMTLSMSFFMAGSDGLVNSPSDEQPNLSQRHAVIAVGHGEALGQRAILVRNSWGAGWGDGGYALITEPFLVPRIFRLAVLMENLDVSARSAAA